MFKTPKMLRIALCLLFAFGATQAAAGPERYRLDVDRTMVSFTYGMGDNTNTGHIPVKSADMLIDLDNVPNSRVSVTLEAREARAGFLFATQAIRGPDMLDTKAHPEIHFRSTAVQGDLGGATITGDLTVRGTTRPVTLAAGLYRQRGTDPGTRDRLTILLTGEISRTAFGVTGFPNYVDDRIGLRIIARIQK